MNPVELVATLSGLACVWLTIRQSIWCWPTGLLMVCLYVWIFFQARLYSDMGLQVVYIGLQLYGWHYWLRGGPRETTAPIRRLAPWSTFGWLCVAAAGTAGLGYAMNRLTDADLPYWDAATTVLSLVAQFLLGRKILENWMFWIAVDVLAVGIYAVKDLYLTTGLYAVFLGLAITGWLTWQQDYRRQAEAAPA